MEQKISINDGNGLTETGPGKKLIFDRIPRRFHEGLFWGNGSMGGLLYVKDRTLRVAVDHSCLWEMRDDGRDSPGGTFQDYISRPENFFNGAFFRDTGSKARYWRTRLPGLTFTLKLPLGIKDFYGELDLLKASSEMELTFEDNSATRVSAYLDANVNVLRIGADTGLLEPKIAGWDMTGELKQLREWGYESCQKVTGGEICHVIQPYSEKGLAVLSMLTAGNGVYVTLKASMRTGKGDSQSFCEENEALLREYLCKEADFLRDHQAVWEKYWSRSDIQVPSARLQRAYEAELYKIFCNEREGRMPVTLMGIWNNDTRMPAWCGDLHNDMNVQACYWPVYKTNHRELGAAYIDYYTSVMPRLMERAYALFGIKNAIHCPIMMGPEGYGAGGEWCLWNSLPGPELFVAVDFIWYYEFTDDDERLISKVYPFLEKVLHLYRTIARRGEDGRLHIPFTNSPEVFQNGAMMIREDATVVIANLHFVLEHFISYGVKLGKENGDWERFRRELTGLTVTDKGYPLFPEEEVFESHRHFCQMFPLFPLGTDIHSPTADRSLDTVIDKGFTEYASWSFPYLAIMASRCGRGNMARTLLEIYCMAFCSSNTFTTNGDPDRNGLLRVQETNAGEPSDTFTLEAGFILAAAMSEMFVHRGGDILYIAYGIPDEWRSCSCRDMTVEGGHRISVSIEQYYLREVVINACRTEEVILSCARTAKEAWLDGIRQETSDHWKLSLEKGRRYRLELR